MFHELGISTPSSVVSLYDPGLVTLESMYGPSHGLDNLWSHVVFWIRLNTRSSTLNDRFCTFLSWYLRSPCMYLANWNKTGILASSKVSSYNCLVVSTSPLMYCSTLGDPHIKSKGTSNP